MSSSIPEKYKFMEEIRLVANSLNDLDDIARTILNRFPEHRVFAIQGDMGAGKTTFIKALCRQLGIGDNVVSPTFPLVNEYRNHKDDVVFHIDFYRINSSDEAKSIGAEEHIHSGAYCFVEWPEKAFELFPSNFIYLTIETNSNLSRTITAGFNGVMP